MGEREGRWGFYRRLAPERFVYGALRYEMHCTPFAPTVPSVLPVALGLQRQSGPRVTKGPDPERPPNSPAQKSKDAENEPSNPGPIHVGFGLSSCTVRIEEPTGMRPQCVRHINRTRPLNTQNPISVYEARPVGDKAVVSQGPGPHSSSGGRSYSVHRSRSLLRTKSPITQSVARACCTLDASCAARSDKVFLDVIAIDVAHPSQSRTSHPAR